MARALKPGGTLVITDADSHTHEWLRTEQHDRWLGFARADISRWFQDAGLEEVAVGDTHEILLADVRVRNAGGDHDLHRQWHEATLKF